MSTPAICKRMKELREELCKRVFTESSYPRKVGRFTITNANPETMSVFDICKRMEELKEELRKRGFYKTCGV